MRCRCPNFGECRHAGCVVTPLEFATTSQQLLFEVSLAAKIDRAAGVTSTPTAEFLATAATAAETAIAPAPL